MQRSAFLINTARASIVGAEALIAALQRKTIARVGLDLFAAETDIDARLLRLPNVVFTAYIGGAVRDLCDVMAHIVVDNIVAILDGEQAPNCWNPAVYVRSWRAI